MRARLCRRPSSSEFTIHTFDKYQNFINWLMSEDPDKIPHNVIFHHDKNNLQRKKIFFVCYTCTLSDTIMAVT